jgi:SAM-dependent methyltransferase
MCDRVVRGAEERLVRPPGGFFMTVRDIAFWLRSSRADSRLDRDRHEFEAAVAFDRLYAAEEDPFGAELPQYRYQQRKYDCLLSMLPRRRYLSALDVGCGLGAFTRKLAPFTDAVLGIDISGVAISQARRRSLNYPNIRYAVSGVVNTCTVGESFDLIVLADTLYYTDLRPAGSLESIAESVTSSLLPGGILLLVNHYFFGIDAASRLTRTIHDVFRNSKRVECTAEYRRAFYLATVLQRAR